ncbi:MAG: cell division topological specificity factor MinE [Sporomusaceae bacterium]|nr:cell division topological specificity factor MinE [Sporomusaceae bacterium]
MLSRLKRLFGEQAGGSKDVAKERLRLVLLHDRATISPQYMGLLREDMIKAVSTYMEINPQQMEVNLDCESQTVTLIANIPVSAVKRPVPPPAATEEMADTSADTGVATGEGKEDDVESTTAAKS